eukprot:1158702-Pelagomonas_calceolata.AAC.22
MQLAVNGGCQGNSCSPPFGESHGTSMWDVQGLDSFTPLSIPCFPYFKCRPGVQPVPLPAKGPGMDAVEGAAR